MTQRALVVGDATVDWFLSLADATHVENVSTAYAWQHEASPAMTANEGGAALIQSLCRAGFARRGRRRDVASWRRFAGRSAYQS